MGEDDFLEAQYEDRYHFDPAEWDEVDYDDEPDAWVIATLDGTMVRGPFGTEEAAERALSEMDDDTLGVAPVYY